MFERIHNTYTTRTQDVDNTLHDDEIESTIKACQRENGECMKSTSGKLRQKYNDQAVTRVLNRLRTRRYRGNQRQELKGDKLMNLLEKLLETKTKQIFL